MVHHCFVDCGQSLWSIRCKVAVCYITEVLNPPEFSLSTQEGKAKMYICYEGVVIEVGVIFLLALKEQTFSRQYMT